MRILCVEIRAKRKVERVNTIVTDFDGTICFDGVTISRDIESALQKLHLAHRLIIASARPVRDLVPVLPASLTDVDIIGGNGAFTRINGVISCTAFPRDVWMLLLRCLSGHEGGILADSSWDYHYSGSYTDSVIPKVHQTGTARNLPLQELGEVAKLVVLSPSPELVAALELLPVRVYQHGSENMIDISPKSINKAEALSRMGVRPLEFIALGNDSNDVDLLASARTAIRVGSHSSLSFAHHTIQPAEVPDALLRLV